MGDSDSGYQFGSGIGADEVARLDIHDLVPGGPFDAIVERVVSVVGSGPGRGAGGGRLRCSARAAWSCLIETPKISGPSAGCQRLRYTTSGQGPGMLEAARQGRELRAWPPAVASIVQEAGPAPAGDDRDPAALRTRRPAFFGALALRFTEATRGFAEPLIVDTRSGHPQGTSAWTRLSSGWQTNSKKKVPMAV